MPSSTPVVTPEVVRKIAALARLRLPEEELPRWTGQLSRIVEYIDQLEAISEEELASAEAEPATPLRADEPHPRDGRAALEENAPRLLHGCGVVPRVVGGS